PPSTSRHPPPLRSTLFPYTTLFRSRVMIEKVDIANSKGCRLRPKLTRSSRRAQGTELSNCFLAHAQRKMFPARTSRQMVERPSIDRKSTRLNSSHDQISYAVFCLKK